LPASEIVSLQVVHVQFDTPFASLADNGTFDGNRTLDEFSPLLGPCSRDITHLVFAVRCGTNPYGVRVEPVRRLGYEPQHQSDLGPPFGLRRVFAFGPSNETTNGIHSMAFAHNVEKAPVFIWEFVEPRKMRSHAGEL